MRIQTVRLCLLIGLIFPTTRLFAQEDQSQVIFSSGENGYACFRIPALIALSPTRILAFAEGRKDNCADFGDVDILMRMSEDGGQTWGSAEVVADYGNLQAGNPTPIMDFLDPEYPQGRLFLFYNTGTASEQETREGQGRRRAFYTTSTDLGKTWTEPVDFSQQVHFDQFSTNPEVDARSLAFAPGHGIQIEDGSAAGRLFIPANHSMGPPQEEFAEYRSYGMFSDNHGDTWTVTPDLAVPASNEAMAASLGGDTLIMTIRMQDRDYQNKLIARSTNAGESWESTWIANDLTTPMCQSSVISVFDSQYKGLFHLGPAATDSRSRLTLWQSGDGGRSWTALNEIWAGSAAYSDLTYLNQGILGLLYERNNYSEIVYESIQLPLTESEK